MDGFRISSWRVEPQLNTIARNGASVRVEPKVMAVLVCLAEQAPATVSREQLLREVWPGTFVSDDVLTRCISELRRVFQDDARESRIIQTIPKRGYRLVVPVENDPAESSTVQPAPARRPRFHPAVFAILALIAVALFLTLLKRPWARDQSTLPRIRSLAVLPLENLAGDASQEYFSDGITDGLITDLARIRSLRVISRTSSMLYKQSKKTLPEIARELGVDGIVEGTVQRSGTRVRITAQLIYAPADKHLWAETYERDMTDLFAIEADVTQQIAGQVEAQVKAQPPPPRVQPLQIRALETYLQGNYLLNKGSGDAEMKQAQDLFAQVIRQNPDYSPAYVGLAYSHYWLLRSTLKDRDERRRAAETAVALDPSSSEAHAALGRMKYADWEFADAENELRHAIALNANNAKAHAMLCEFLNAMARLDDSLAECQIAQQLDPDYDHLSQTMELRGNFSEAIKLLEKSVEQHPTDAFLCYYLYRDYALNGNYDQAVAALERSIRLVGLSQAADRVEIARHANGYKGALTQYARELEQLHTSGTLFMPRLVAEVYAQIGDKERAFYWLEQGFREHRRVGSFGGIDWILVEHELDPLHSDIRWRDLLHRVGLPEHS